MHAALRYRFVRCLGTFLSRMCPSTSPLASRILYRSAGWSKRGLAPRLIPIRTLALGANFREHRFSRWPYVIAPQTGVVGYLDGAQIDFLSGRSARTISNSSAACATWRDRKLRREARNSRTASRIAYSVERGSMCVKFLQTIHILLSVSIFSTPI